MSRFKCTDLLLINSSKLWQIPWHSALYGKFHYMTAFRDSAHIFRIVDIIGYIEVFCNFSVVDYDLLQLQQRLLLLYLWETTDAWSLRQLQLASALGVRLHSVFRVDWSDSWLSTYQMSGGRRLLWVLRPQSVELRQAASYFTCIIYSPINNVTCK